MPINQLHAVLTNYIDLANFSICFYVYNFLLLAYRGEYNNPSNGVHYKGEFLNGKYHG